MQIKTVGHVVDGARLHVGEKHPAPRKHRRLHPQLPPQPGVDLQIAFGGQGKFPAADAGFLEHLQKKRELI